MKKQNIVVAIHNADNQKNNNTVFNYFAQGLKNGFKQIGVETYSTKECLDNNIPFNMAIGFDTDEIQLWPKILSNNITNIMWTTDSAFGVHSEVIEQFSTFDKFVLFEVTPADKEALTKYLPTLKHGYIPHATDTNLWKKTNLKKENNIVYIDSIIDYEKKYEELKEQMPPLVYELMMQIREFALKAPHLTFWQICDTIKKALGLELDKEQYEMLFKNLAYTIDSEKKVKIIEALSKFDIKIYGNDLWSKYTTNNVKYMGNVTTEESIKIIEQSKISLHYHPITLGLGIQESILNASAVETFSLINDTPSIKVEFEDAFGYYNTTNYDDIANNVEFYLTNDDKREELTQKAFDITTKKHSWKNRAQSIIEITE